MLLKDIVWGAWVAQWVKCLTLGFGSVDNLTVHEFKPHVGLCAASVEPNTELEPMNYEIMT